MMDVYNGLAERLVCEHIDRWPMVITEHFDNMRTFYAIQKASYEVSLKILQTDRRDA